MSSSPSVFPKRPSSPPRLIVVHSDQDGPGLAKRKTANLSTHTPGQTIREMRRHLGMSRDELATEMGISESTLCRWERDELQVDRAECLRVLVRKAVGL